MMSRNPNNPFVTKKQAPPSLIIEPSPSPTPSSPSSIYSEYIPSESTLITRPEIQDLSSPRYLPPFITNYNGDDPPLPPLRINKPPIYSAPFIRGKSQPFPPQIGRDYPQYPYHSRKNTRASLPPPYQSPLNSPFVPPSPPRPLTAPAATSSVGPNPDPGNMYYDVVLEAWRLIPQLEGVGGGEEWRRKRDKVKWYAEALLGRSGSLRRQMEEKGAKREDLKKRISAPLGTGKRR